MNLMKFDSLQCERTRGQLDAYLSNELLVETTGEVLKHLENCADCSFELESRARMRGALRKAATTIAPPENLQPAIQRRLRQSQPVLISGFPRSTWAMALAAMVLVIITAIATLQWRSFERGKQLVAGVLSLGVSDHLQCAIKGHNYADVAPSQEKLREKLGTQYAGLLPVVEEKLPGFQVLEAHLCSLNGSPRKYIHFIARGRGTILSVILTRREGSSFPAGNFLKAGASQGLDLFQASFEGMHAAGFESNEFFGFVVSDLGQDEVMKIATEIAPPLRNALDGPVSAAEVETSPVFRRS
ncbi:MAG TPA: zf-HC2 domain-containing protein [Terriglobia bacterium]|nr:zf-HC2 domain-containing protein [Terriglobia bacterium]